MKPNDYLWVGLKLLGVYLLVSGVATLSGTSYFLAVNFSQITSNFASSTSDILKERSWEQIIYGGVLLLAGVFLFSCTNMLVRRSRDEQFHDS